MNMYELVCTAAEKLRKDAYFLHVSRALSGTISFRNEMQKAYMVFYQGKILETGEGASEYGSDYIIYASDENWKKAFDDNPRYGIYELDGKYIQFEGNMYTFAGNALAFYELWGALRKTFEELTA